MHENLPTDVPTRHVKITTLTEERDQARVDLAEEKAEGVRIREKLTTRDEFLAVVSHDLLAPLSIIAMGASQLLEIIDSDTDQKLRIELIAMVLRNAETMGRLISDLLDVERMASNKLDLKLVKRDVNVLAKDSVENFLAIGIAKGIAIELRLSPVPLIAEFDVDRIRQVISNLLTNAIKFTQGKGKIVVETHHEGSSVRVSVQDSGPGITKDQQDRIFKRNSQVKRDSRGLGLGLYISHWLVAAHNGRIWVESDGEKGSQFHFELPVTP